jgi:hypothetical protein
MKLETILQYNDIFKNLIDNAKEINALVKFRLLGIVKQFEPIVTNFEIVREEKIRQYGKQQENGSIGIVPPDKDKFENEEEYNKAEAEFHDAVAAFNADMNELLQSDVDIEIKKFKPDEVIDVGIPADFLVLLYDFIEE